MRYLLIASLAANVVQLVMWLRAHFRKWGRPLPKKKPDFVLIEQTLRELIRAAGLDSKLELRRFDRRDWLCFAEMVSKGPDVFSHESQITELIQKVRDCCGVPGRRAGLVVTEDNPPRIIGSRLEFGYSTEVGYRHQNEFSVAALVQG